MNRYVVAVSGGVDSVVLLDILSRQQGVKLIVAHFDHGIREDSAEDAKFVENLAKSHGLPFETKREDLGKDCSEDKARIARYKFLRSVARKHDAQLVTAHHADDVIETIAINLTRGTGWRGLASMDSDIVRPMTKMSKNEIIKYAKLNKLKWREDSTNASDAYLRNRLRQKIAKLSDDEKRQLLALWRTQKHIKKQINEETMKLVGNTKKLSRYFFTHIDDCCGLECIRHISNGKLTRPQASKAHHAIKTAQPLKTYHAGNNVELNFTSRNFTVKLLK